MFEWWLWLIHGAFFHSSISERKEQACAGKMLLPVTKGFFTWSTRQNSRLWYSSYLQSYSDRRLASCKVRVTCPEDTERISPVDMPSKRLAPRHAFALSCHPILPNHRFVTSRTPSISPCSRSKGHFVSVLSCFYFSVYLSSILLPVLSLLP